MSHIVSVRCPQARTKAQALAAFAHTDQCRVSDVSSRWDGKPCRLSDLSDVNERRPFLERATVQIRYCDDRKVCVVTVRALRKVPKPTTTTTKAAPTTTIPLNHVVLPQVRDYLNVYRECVIALDMLDLDEDDRPHHWRVRLPLYAIATSDYRAAIDLGDVDERAIAIRARDAAFARLTGKHGGA